MHRHCPKKDCNNGNVTQANDLHTTRASHEYPASHEDSGKQSAHNPGASNEDIKQPIRFNQVASITGFDPLKALSDTTASLSICNDRYWWWSGKGPGPR